MKKFIKRFVIGFCSVSALVFIAGCSSLGVATSGANYFNGKKEADLVKYFKYDGVPVKAEGDYDKVVRFSNLITTVYVDKTTTEKFKNRKNVSIQNFKFTELPDGCLLLDGTVHYSSVKVTQANPNGTVTKTEKGTHSNDNNSINSKINSFNSAVKQYNAVAKTDDNLMFNKTVVGKSYYTWDIVSNKMSYSDEKLGNTSALFHQYFLNRVDVYEDSKSSTETHIAYIHNDHDNQYTDEKGNLISEADAFSNERSYIAKGFASRKKDKGVALLAYIKDGVVVKVE